MNKILATTIIVLVLIFLIIPLSKIITQKRVIVIEGPPKSAFGGIVAGPPECCQEQLSAGKRISALFLGMAGEGNNAPNLTDTIMIVNINKETNQGFLLSIPRDFLVKAPGTNHYTKINALYQNGGLDAVAGAVSEITGLDFDYKIVIDLEGVKEIIDQIGGIDIFIEKDIYDPAFPGPNNSYQTLVLKSGWQHLDGETALKYVRTRHDPTGDFARMARQQKVLIALKDKISSLHPFWNLAIIMDIWRTLMGHFQTNLSLQNIKTFWQMAKNIDLEKIDFKVLDPTTGLVIPDHSSLGNEEAYILKPSKGLNDYSDIRAFVKNLLR